MLKRKNKIRRPSPIKLIIRVISTALILCICIGVSHYACRNTITDTNDTEFNISSGNNKIIANYGLLYFHYYDIKGTIVEHFFTDRSLNDEEKQKLDEFFAEKRASSKGSSAKYKGIAEGKNLIVIQMEAIQQFLINTEYNGKEITPNLNKFINDSIYFDNFFYQVGAGNTSDAEFLTNNSLYPLKEGAVYFKYPYNTYESLPNILNSKGYNTYVFHANKPSYWNRNEMYKSVGFKNFISSSKFTQDDVIGWGLNDKSMFKQSLDKIDTSKPFYTFYITLSSHHPYSYFSDFDNFDVTGCNNEMAANYMKAANYVDEAIGEFFDMLKTKGLYDNSVIVIYGDHHAVMKDQTDVLTELTGFRFTDYNWTMQQKTPCFIHFPGMDKKGVNNIVCGEIDILPTIANLMGFEVPHAIGKDILNAENGYAVLRDSSVITDEFAFIASEEKVYDNNGNPTSLDKYESVIADYQHELDISEIILKKNALKYYKQ
jgi:phosphoglycerol transferase MdoB-like AlkP superfamily enzyme